MSGALWLGVDVGTQGVRVVLVGPRGRIEGAALTPFHNRAGPPGAMTHDPLADWTVGTNSAIRAAIAGTDTHRIAGVGVCGLFPAFVALDITGEPIGEAILYGDSRAREHVALAEHRLGVTLTGDEVSPRLLWLRDVRPIEFERAARIVGPTGFVVHLLTGRATIDCHSAYRWGGLIDATRSAWLRTSVQALGISVELLPDIVAPHAMVGCVTPEAAADTGLLPGTPVAGGTTDSFATFVGHGAVHCGDIVIYYGSSWTVMSATTDLENVLHDPSPIGEGVPWRLVTYAIDAGRFIEQLRHTMFEGRSYQELDAGAETVPAGARGIAVFPLPTGRFDGRRLVPTSGAIVGFGIESESRDLWRATLESFGHLAMDGLWRLGERRQPAHAAGGGARSAIWRRIVTDMTGLEQRYDPRGSAAFGAAFLASFGLGGVTTLDPIAEGWLTGEDAAITRPGPNVTSAYAGPRLAWRVFERALTQNV